jgi:outer membrane protein assembly factor BamE
MFRSPLLQLCAVVLLLAACSSPLSSINAYKIDIQQGNVLTQEMVAQLGTPLLADVFHQDRWDYAYSYRNGRTGVVDTRYFSVFFDQNNRLVKVSGDVEVAGLEDLGAPKANTRLIDFGSLPTDGTAPPMPPPEGEGFIKGMLKSIGL